MKRISFVLGLIGLSLVANADVLRSQIDTANKAIEKAIMKRDIASFSSAVKKGTTKDFKYSERGKTQTWDEMVSHMKMGLTMLKTVSAADSKVISLTEKGNMATGKTMHVIKGSISGQDHKIHKVELVGSSTETYRKEGGKWLMSRMEWTDQSMTIDGKKIAEPKG